MGECLVFGGTDDLSDRLRGQSHLRYVVAGGLEFRLGFAQNIDRTGEHAFPGVGIEVGESGDCSYPGTGSRRCWGAHVSDSICSNRKARTEYDAFCEKWAKSVKFCRQTFRERCGDNIRQPAEGQHATCVRRNSRVVVICPGCE